MLDNPTPPASYSGWILLCKQQSQGISTPCYRRHCFYILLSYNLYIHPVIVKHYATLHGKGNYKS